MLLTTYLLFLIISYAHISYSYLVISALFSLTASTITEENTEDAYVVIPRSVNYFISRKCNYSCKFCFHTAKTSHSLPIEQSAKGLRLLKDAGCEKINFAGGEPFLHPILLGDLCQVASGELGMAVSIISNGSLISNEWMEMYAKRLGSRQQQQQAGSNGRHQQQAAGSSSKQQETSTTCG